MKRYVMAILLAGVLTAPATANFGFFRSQSRYGQPTTSYYYVPTIRYYYEPAYLIVPPAPTCQPVAPPFEIWCR